MKCAFLTCEDLPNMIDEELALIKLLAKKNIDVDIVIWSQKTNWSSYECVVIRTTWDYYLQSDLFLGVLQEIADSGCRLFNTLDIVRWNTNKNYLIDLQQKGIPVIPTKIIASQQERRTLFSLWKTNKVVIKPTISAGAYHTYLVEENQKIEIPDLPVFYMAQPFCESVVSEGEWSFMFFGGQFSHAIIKRPQKNDFRVQEEHGGSVLLVKPEAADLEQATKVIESIPIQLYARVDMIRYEHKLHLVELELIEPQLYFQNSTAALSSFVEAFCNLSRK
ncbi:RimK family alpha-L-glutamate ligase [Candidatus Uabimicrobium sp. HlEnr_7]|uniref:ATP-grasp domain-containing protein n=1 Tax=Candidatus Uabimicrobium helgolandensis TaxID=3095367 RepID=UPI0035588BE9